MECPNTVTIRSGAGVTVFSMDDAGDLWFREDWNPGIDMVVIDLEGGERVSGGNEYLHAPSITLSWLDSPFNLDRLLNRTVHIPLSYSEEHEDHATNFYYGEHLDFDNVYIKFVERDGDRFRVRVTGKTIDIESDVQGDMTVEIDTYVSFVDRNSPPVYQPPRTVDGIGDFVNDEWRWECTTKYADHQVEVRLSSQGDRFDKFARYAQKVVRQELVSLETLRENIKSELPNLKWKFDNFNVVPNFDASEFVPETLTITEADKKSDAIHLYVFLTHPKSGTDNWILRYSNSELYSLEWIPDR